MNHFHKNGLIHRDIAARNIFIDDKSKAIIGDLGLVKAFQIDDKTQYYRPAYEPEPSSPASDVFQFGVLLFEIATECAFDDLFSPSKRNNFHKLVDAANLQHPNVIKKLPSFLSKDAGIIQLMLRCITFPNSSRPTAAEVESSLCIMMGEYIPKMTMDVKALMESEQADGDMKDRKENIETQLVLQPASVQDDIERDKKSLIEQYRQLAEQGNAGAQFKLGDCLFEGEGVDQDEKAAAEWYRRAAEQDHALAQFCLARCLKNGSGVIKNNKAAVEWYRKAAKQGHAAAQLNLLLNDQSSDSDKDSAVVGIVEHLQKKFNITLDNFFFDEEYDNEVVDNDDFLSNINPQLLHDILDAAEAASSETPLQQRYESAIRTLEELSPHDRIDTDHAQPLLLRRTNPKQENISKLTTANVYR